MSKTRWARFGGQDLFVSVALLSASADADVTEYSLERHAVYEQTSIAAPTTASRWFLVAKVVANVSGEMNSASISFQGPPLRGYVLTQSTAFTRQFGSQNFPDEAAFLTDFPRTTYTFTVERTSDILSGDLTATQDFYSSETPTFTGDTFDRMQTVNPGSPFNGAINGFSLSGASQTSIAIAILDNFQNTVWSATLPRTSTTFQVPAGALLPQTDYTISMTYFTQNTIPNAGFNGATGKLAFFRTTTATVSTQTSTSTCPADFDNDGTVDFFDYDAFVSCFEGASCPPGQTADFDNDGTVDFFDYDAFVVEFETPC